MMRTRVALLDELLERHAAALGADREPYRNHCYRVLNFCAARDDALALEKTAIAAAFHDLGIWSDGTWDYLDPSERRARAYLGETGRDAWGAEIGAMIQEHHRITSAKAAPDTLAEAFRKADWIDVSLGAFTGGLPRSYVAEVRAAFPNVGFHRRLVQLASRRLLTKPWSPMPMMKW